MKSNISNLIDDLFKWLKAFYCEVKGFLNDLSRNPLVVRFFNDLFNLLKKVFGVFLAKISLLRKKAYFGFAVFYLIISFSIMFLLWSAVYYQVSDRSNKRRYLINIPAGYGASQVSDMLYNSGIIDSRYSFELLVSLYRLENNIKAGAYKFSPSMGIGEIATKLKNGDIVAPTLAKIVFPEGTSVYRMGEILKDEELDGGDKFKNFIKDSVTADLIDKFPFLSKIPTNSLEGYLFPDTYLVPFDITIDSIRDLMLSRFSAVIMPLWSKAYEDTNLSLHEIITLASIIEKEAAVDEERTIISSVFHNRLRKRMYLGADPTVKYALSPFRKPTKKVFYIDLEVDSPYNTYKNIGLPPGPICNPGLASIKAAIYPAETDYIYFVARKDGTHIFTKTWQEHEKAKASLRR